MIVKSVIYIYIQILYLLDLILWLYDLLHIHICLQLVDETSTKNYIDQALLGTILIALMSFIEMGVFESDK